MKLLFGNRAFSLGNRGVVATIGNFDGIHLGHQNLIKTLKKEASRLKLPLVVILFEPQPKEYFVKKEAPARLSTLREKLNALEKCGVDYVYCIKFNKKLAETSAPEFATHYLFNRLKVTHLLVGEDFKFGKNREGNVALLKKIGALNSCAVEIFPEFHANQERISSTGVRLALALGDLEHAAQLLGRPYSLCGRVIKGDGRGRQWGIPTANIGLQRISLPLKGVFIVRVSLNSQTVFGVANIGSRPTVDGTKNILEVHLFDFNESIYGEMTQVYFLHKIRNETKFESVESLIIQIHKDIAAATAYLNILETDEL